MQLLSHRNPLANPLLSLKGKCRAGQGRCRRKPDPSLRPQAGACGRGRHCGWCHSGGQMPHWSGEVRGTFTPESLEGPLSACCGGIFKSGGRGWDGLYFKDLSVAFPLLAPSCSCFPGGSGWRRLSLLPPLLAPDLLCAGESRRGGASSTTMTLQLRPRRRASVPSV